MKKTIYKCLLIAVMIILLRSEAVQSAFSAVYDVSTEIAEELLDYVLTSIGPEPREKDEGDSNAFEVPEPMRPIVGTLLDCVREALSLYSICFDFIL